MFLQQIRGLGKLLGNHDKQTSIPHYGSIESHVFCQCDTWKNNGYTMLWMCEGEQIPQFVKVTFFNGVVWPCAMPLICTLEFQPWTH